MNTTIIIPARYASKRLPCKPLLDETGKPLIQHVVENAMKAEVAERVVVATDSERILEAIMGFGGEAVMTRKDHDSGTDRLAEAADKIGLSDEDVVINIQGDEPDIPPGLISRLASLIGESGAPMATLCTPLDPEEADNPNKVKVVISRDGRALYFSRSRIPCDRDDKGADYLLHMGLYAYRVGFLKVFTSLEPTPLEKAERLEQLRALENAFPIAIAVVEYDGIGIDTPEDYAEFVRRMAGSGPRS